MFDDQDGCEWVNVSFGTSPQRAVERLYVRVIHFNICKIAFRRSPVDGP